MYNDPSIVLIIFLAVLAGGLVKGTLGFGSIWTKYKKFRQIRVEGQSNVLD